MRTTFDARLVNDAFGDPGVYVDFKFERRALLFDLGDNAPLAPRHLLRLTHAFVSHTHMDHFIGFDRLVRICVGRHAGIRLFGPPGFVDQVERRLGAYTWDRVDRYDVELALDATEVDAAGSTRAARFRTRSGFAREPLPDAQIEDGVLVDEPSFRVRCVLLDHRTPCLGFALEEKTHVNVWKNRLAEMGLEVGPWVGELKALALAGAGDDAPVRAWWRTRDGVHERTLAFGALRSALEFVPGQRVAYVTDVVYHDENVARIARLARGADALFIESVFLETDVAHATQKQHLTARQAGTIARRAGARSVVPFHFSPRYAEREAALRAELEAAFRGGAAEIPDAAHALATGPAGLTEVKPLSRPGQYGEIRREIVPSVQREKPMQVPLQISFHDVPQSEALEARIREKAARLETFYPRIMSCRVAVEATDRHKHQGKHFAVRLDVRVPGKEIVASRDDHEDVYVALREAFDAARRQLEEYADARRSEVKSRAAPGEGA